MPTDLTEIYTIRHVQPGDPVSAPVTSQPTKAIELRLRAVESALYSAQLNTSQSRLVIPNVDINNIVGQAVTENSVVYYNNATGLYEKAVAGVTFQQDQFLANSSALALGVCVAVRGNKGDIMVAGYSPWDAAVQENMLMVGEQFRAGVPYYLTEDASQAGRVTQYAPSLRVQVLSATQEHFILQPEYGVPEVLETVSRVAVGARPVGSLRVDDVSGVLCRIVAFDALEELEPYVWASTKDSAISDLRNFGWVAADIELTQIPSKPVWIRVDLKAGSLMVYTSNNLEELTTNAPKGRVFNIQSYGPLDASNFPNIRQYTVKESFDATFPLGTFSFSFVSPDTTLNRMCIFQFPTSFQGWKMINPPVVPQGVATVSNGSVAGVTMLDGGAGYLTPPRVTFSLPPGGAAGQAKGVAILNTAGSIQEVQIPANGAGGGYKDPVTNQPIIPTITFDSAVKGAEVVNGGSGAVLSASTGTGVTAGQVTTIAITNAGSGYASTPAVLISDKKGVGSGATAVATVRDGKVVEVIVTSGGAGYTANQVRAEIVLPSNFDYAVSKQPVVTVTMKTGLETDQIDSVIVGADPGYGIINGSNIKFIPSAGNTPTTEAQGYVTAHPVTGKVESVQVTNAGAGYAGFVTVQFATKEPRLKTDGGNPVEAAAGTLTMSPAKVARVEVESRGIRYVGVAGGPGGAFWVPLVFEAAACPGGDVAVGMAVLNSAGSVVDIVLQHGGSGYIYTPTVMLNDGANLTGYNFVGRVHLSASVLGATVTSSGKQFQYPTASVAATPVKSVTIMNGGSGYSVGTVLLVTGGTPTVPAVVEPVFNGTGGLSGATVIYPGKGYVTPPTIVSRGPGFGATWGAIPILNGQISIATIPTGSIGAEYIPGATCTVAPPDLLPTYGQTAVIKPRTGGTLSLIRITNAGTAQTKIPGMEPEIVLSTSQYGWGAKLRPLFNTLGELVNVEILDPGTGYVSGDTITWAYTGVNLGTKATLEFTFAGYDQVTRVDVVQPGWGYSSPPKLVVSPPPSSQYTTAVLEASLLGVGAKLETDMWGLGPPLLNHPMPTRNIFQVRSWYEDMGYQVGHVKPEAAFYYNMWADLSLRQRYPPVPLDRAAFLLNGTEVSVTTLSSDFKPAVLSADVWLASDAIYWPTADILGAPWDSDFKPMINAPEMPGVDCLIPDTAETEELLWRWRSHVYSFQPQINVSWMHLGRASQFYTAGRVSGLAVVPPLQLVNLVTGEILSDTGRPATGILGLQLSSNGSIFSSDATVDLAQPNVLVIIYQNGQRQPVYLSSFLLRVMFQSVSTGEVATVNASARITIGTQAGNYQNMVGNYNPATPNNSSVATTLYGMGQVKELLPDQDFPSVLVYPGEAVYLRVAVPAGNPIRQQTVNVSVRGYVL